MHHWVTYMYINFQQNLVNRSVIIGLHKFIPQKSKLHKLATTNNNFEKMDDFRHASLGNVQVYQFSAKSG